MKRKIFIIALLLTLVLITSCNLGPTVDEPKVPDEVKQTIEGEPNQDSSSAETQNGNNGTTEGKKEDSNRIDKILDKTFTAKGSTIYIDSESIISFTISKDEEGQYKLTGDNGKWVFIIITEDKYYFGEEELVISEDLKTITIGENKIYGTTE